MTAIALEWGDIHWVCDPRFITCPRDHLYSFKKQEGFSRDHRRLSGYEFFQCRQCAPATFWFAVFTTQPTPAAFCYEISESCWKEWMDDNAQLVLSTTEMLYLIRDPQGRSYNPTFRPPVR